MSAEAEILEAEKAGSLNLQGVGKYLAVVAGGVGAAALLGIGIIRHQKLVIEAIRSGFSFESKLNISLEGVNFSVEASPAPKA